MHERVERLRARRETHRTRSRLIRALYAVVGLTILAAGVAMLVLPGPALLVIPIGLAILSLEFAWAERLLDRALDEAAKAERNFNTPAERRMLAAFAVLGIAAVVTWAIIGDIPVLPG